MCHQKILHPIMDSYKMCHIMTFKAVKVATPAQIFPSLLKACHTVRQSQDEETRKITF